MTFTITPIGHVRGGRHDNLDDDWGDVTAAIELDANRFSADALLGLDAFSHVDVVFLFDRIPEGDIEWTSRHPRGNLAWPKVGIFAQRGAQRPNRLGVTIARIVSVKDHTLIVQGLDAIDGTPVIDIKPVMRGFQPRGEIREPDWAGEIMTDYWAGPIKPQ